jgi:hypothetical protein
MDDNGHCSLLIRLVTGHDAAGLSGTLSRFDEKEWREFLDFAARHRMAPLLYAQVKKLGLDTCVPEPFLKEIKTAYHRTAARNMRLYSELATILSVLKKANIPVIVLKGSFLAEIVYNNIAARPMADIDLLIKKNDLVRAIPELKRTGRTYSEFPNTDVKTRNDAILSIFDDGKEFPIDVHTAFEHGRTSMDMEGIWQRAQLSVIAGEKALALAPEDLLCHLCFHAAYQHGFGSGLLPLQDIYLSTVRYGDRIDWKIFWDRARRHGVLRGMLLIRGLTKDLFGLEFPEPKEKGEKPEEFKPMLSGVKELALTGRKIAVPFSRDFAVVFGDASIFAKVRAIVKSIFLPRQTIAMMYNCRVNSWWIYLCYFKRIVGLIKKYCFGWVRIVVAKENDLKRWAKLEMRRLTVKNKMEE